MPRIRNISERCPGDQANNRAELIVRDGAYPYHYTFAKRIPCKAISRALESSENMNAPLLIKTDSRYSMDCMHDCYNSSVVIFAHRAIRRSHQVDSQLDQERVDDLEEGACEKRRSNSIHPRSNGRAFTNGHSSEWTFSIGGAANEIRCRSHSSMSRDTLETRVT